MIWAIISRRALGIPRHLAVRCGGGIRSRGLADLWHPRRLARSPVACPLLEDFIATADAGAGVGGAASPAALLPVNQSKATLFKKTHNSAHARITRRGKHRSRSSAENPKWESVSTAGLYTHALTVFPP